MILRTGRTVWSGSTPPPTFSRPHEQRKIEQLLVKLSKAKPISAKECLQFEQAALRFLRT